MIHRKKTDISSCIAELLSLHDCVIIPGLGGFIGNYSPARIDQVHHIFHPPTKSILFNINLKQNDGLLANAVASSSGTSYADACMQIDHFAENCRATLNAGNPFLISLVGQLIPGREGIIHFEQDQLSNLLPDAFGLTQFISPPVLRNPVPLVHPPRSVHGMTRPGNRYSLYRTLKRVAVIALLIGTAAVIGLTQYDKISANFANNAGILTSVYSRFSSASLVEKKEAPVGRIKTITVPVAEVIPAEKPVQIRDDDHFAVIVGAFRVHENAEKFVVLLQQKGIRASIFDQSRTGLYRVTIGTSSDRNDAKQILASAKALELNGAWLLAK